MPSEKEIEWAQKEISRLPAGWGLPYRIMVDAYLSMKSERDKYKEIVEKDTEALQLALGTICNDCRGCGQEDIKRCREKCAIDSALSLRDKKEE